MTQTFITDEEQAETARQSLAAKLGESESTINNNEPSQKDVISQTESRVESEQKKTDEITELQKAGVDKVNESEIAAPKSEDVEKVELPKEKIAEIENITLETILKDEKQEGKQPIVNDELIKTQAELQKTKQILDDEQVKLALKITEDAKKAGKSIPEFLAGIRGEDINKLTPKQIFERHLDTFTELTPEERIEELEKFDSKSKFEQLKETAGFKNELINSQNKAFDQYVVKTSEKDGKSSHDEEIKTIILEKERTRAHAELADLLSQKEYKNLVLTPEVKQSVSDWCAVNLRANEEGIFNIKEGFKTAIATLYPTELISANRKAATTKAKLDFFNEHNRPSKETPSSGIPPGADPDADFKEAMAIHKKEKEADDGVTVKRN